MKATCPLSVIPMRKEPSDKSEMINQVLYGEHFDIIKQQEKWSKVRLHHDGYEGWIDNKQYTLSTTKQKKQYPIAQLYAKHKTDKDSLLLPMGAFILSPSKNKPSSILHTAKKFINTPYLWGGRTFMGIDCSGFTQIVFRVNNISLLRDAYQQATQGKKIEWKDVTTNDLAFFSNDAGKVTHVGIVIRKKNHLEIIHASGKVRIDKLDEKGIYKNEIKGYSHHLHSIKRILK